MNKQNIKYVLELTQEEYDWCVALHGLAVSGNNAVSFGVYRALADADEPRCHKVFDIMFRARVPDHDVRSITKALGLERAE